MPYIILYWSVPITTTVPHIYIIYSYFQLTTEKILHLTRLRVEWAYFVQDIEVVEQPKNVFCFNI